MKEHCGLMEQGGDMKEDHDQNEQKLLRNEK